MLPSQQSLLHYSLQWLFPSFQFPSQTSGPTFSFRSSMNWNFLKCRFLPQANNKLLANNNRGLSRCPRFVIKLSTKLQWESRFSTEGTPVFKTGKMFWNDKHKLISLHFSKREIKHFSGNLKINFVACVFFTVFHVSGFLFFSSFVSNYFLNLYFLFHANFKNYTFTTILDLQESSGSPKSSYWNLTLLWWSICYH